MMTQLAISTFTVLVLVITKADGQTCRFGSPGEGCRYRCNCAVNCHAQAGCRGMCAQGYDGPTCQRHNVALNQTTSQSSDFSLEYTSRLAVDGKLGHHRINTPCTLTSVAWENWWIVTLDSAYSIYRFQIYNRNENFCGFPSCGRRLNGFTVSVGTNGQFYSDCYTDTTTSDNGPGDVINGTCSEDYPRTGNTVRIGLPANVRTALTLCEVRLFVCSTGWYGELCDKECVTGTRCSRCDNSGIRCVSCVPRRWGTDCDRDCGHCWNNTYCDRNTGLCPASSPTCESGFQGDNCTTPCIPGRHGPDCRESCGSCAQGRDACNRTSGHCPTEPNNATCLSGFTSPDCKTRDGQSCRFGSPEEDCRYRCNCAVDCDRQIGCRGTCLQGWDGPTCQRRNVALNQTTSQSSNFEPRFPSGLAVDGKLGHNLVVTPCTHTGFAFNNWWRVTLDRVYSIYRFQIYNRNGYCGSPTNPCGRRLNGFTLSVGTNNQSFYPCYTDGWESNNGPGDIINGICGQRLSGNTVQISLSRYTALTLCEVRLFICSNGWHGEFCDQECAPGCFKCYSQTRCLSCVTGRWGPNCDKGCGHCSNNTACDRNSGLCPALFPRCEGGFQGDNCTTPCMPGHYGPDCGVRCGFCSQGRDPCNRTSGHCPEEPNKPTCMSGYTGPVCKTVCSSYRWGPDCVETCGRCHNGVVCDSFSGECPQHSPRCATGYTGHRCEPCDSGTWGNNCSNTCSKKCMNPACNVTTGVCDEGCHPGYTGRRCDRECPPGSWGDNCVKNCSANCINPTCDVTTGVCEEGCLAGYTGNSCETEAALATPTSELPIGGVAGGVSGAVVLILIVVVVVLVIRRRRRGFPQKDPDAELQPSHLAAIPKDDDAIPQDNDAIPQDDNAIPQDDDAIPQDDDAIPQDNPGYNEEDNDDEENNDDEDAAVDVVSAGFVNPSTVQESTCVPVDEFRRYMLRKKTSVGFKTEFETFPVGLHAKHDVANRPENKIKSRYRNLVAYDHSRVPLKKIDDEDTDYINACYIDGYNEPKKYIASQGPTDVIVDDFMRMFWEQVTGKVVMLTNLVEKTKTKCYQYWPDKGSKKFGSITVSLLDEENFSNYVIRTLQLKHEKNKTQLVKQFHFRAWPDHGAPSNASCLLDFLEKVLGHKSPQNGPIVVHCSAGIGRTGTFIALDYLINQAKEEGVVDVPACVRLLREQRVNMVQSLEQYEFLHDALAEALELQEGSIPGVNFSGVFADLRTVNPETGQLKLAEQFQRLNEKTPPLDKATLVTALKPDNRKKNRSNKIVAADNCRPFLSTPVPGKNNYINAVYLPSYMMKRGFIITHTPLPETVVDFWRLVYDHGISTIVMLDNVDNETEDVGIYWTEKRKTVGPFDVKFAKKEEEKDFTVWTYRLAYKDTKVSCPIKQFRCEFWSSTPSPASIPSLLSAIDSVTSWQKEAGNQPILVHCRDGLTHSGLFCAASFVLERLKLDRDVNIPQAVKQMRVARPQIITDLDQYQFLHEVALGYLDTFGTYANFK